MVIAKTQTGSYRPTGTGFKTLQSSTAKTLSTSSKLTWLEKGGQKGGLTTLEEISNALDEYSRLFKAGIASSAEKFTLARAFPDAPSYVEATKTLSPDSLMVIGGPASVEMIDKEGHLITTDALSKAFDKYMDNFRTRNAMVLHSDVQVGWALPAYITKGGQIYKSGIHGKELFFICELRNDTKIAERVMKQIDEGKLRSYSIAGSATKVQNVQKGATPYMQVDDMELAEVTVCEKGVNEGASFQILKAQTGKIDKEQAGYRPATEIELTNNIMCGTCKYFNPEDKTCDSVDGVFEDTDYCKLFDAIEAPVDDDDSGTMKVKVRIMLSDDNKIDFTKTLQELVKNPEWSTSEVQTQRDWWDFTKEDKENPMTYTERLVKTVVQDLMKARDYSSSADSELGGGIDSTAGLSDRKMKTKPVTPTTTTSKLTSSSAKPFLGGGAADTQAQATTSTLAGTTRKPAPTTTSTATPHSEAGFTGVGTGGQTSNKTYSGNRSMDAQPAFAGSADALTAASEFGGSPTYFQDIQEDIKEKSGAGRFGGGALRETGPGFKGTDSYLGQGSERGGYEDEITPGQAYAGQQVFARPTSIGPRGTGDTRQIGVDAPQNFYERQQDAELAAKQSRASALEQLTEEDIQRIIAGRNTTKMQKSFTQRLIKLYKQQGTINFKTPSGGSNVVPSRGRGSAQSPGSVSPAMGNPELELAHDPTRRDINVATERHMGTGDPARRERQRMIEGGVKERGRLMSNLPDDVVAKVKAHLEQDAPSVPFHPNQWDSEMYQQLDPAQQKDLMAYLNSQMADFSYTPGEEGDPMINPGISRRKGFGSANPYPDTASSPRENMTKLEKMTARVMNKLTKANDDPFTTKESFTTLNNEEVRQQEHDQLLREYGFPSAVPLEAGRYIPVVEVETTDKGIPINNKGPWVVNEAGQEAGELLDEDAPSFSASEKAHNRSGEKTADVSKSYLISPPVVPFMSARSM